MGDPLSPLLFILSIGALLNNTDPDIGFQVDNLKIGALSYAHVLVLLAQTPTKIQKKLTTLNCTLKVMGMSFNAAKSKGLTELFHLPSEAGGSLKGLSLQVGTPPWLAPRS